MFTSFSFTFTRTSMLLRLAMRMISVPAIWVVPTTRSPFFTLSLLTVPLTGA